MTARLAVILVPSLALACTSTRTVETRTPAGSASHLELAPGTKGPVLSEWKATNDGVEGDLVFARCVEVLEEREAIENRKVTGPDATANGLLIVGGLVAARVAGATT